MLIETLKPVCEHIAGLDLSDPAACEASLRHAFADRFEALREAVLAEREAGRLTPRSASPHVKFGRVSKPVEATSSLSIDAVEMSGAGAEHTHPKGEVSLAFALEGPARFMGRPEGWIVVEPGSRHVPTVTEGSMVIVYFLPDGQMVFH